MVDTYSDRRVTGSISDWDVAGVSDMAWALDSPAKLDFGQSLRDDLVLSVNGTLISRYARAPGDWCCQLTMWAT
jgi:hypothetical protein